jgi:hypothetical protein
VVGAEVKVVRRTVVEIDAASGSIAGARHSTISAAPPMIGIAAVSRVRMRGEEACGAPGTRGRAFGPSRDLPPLARRRRTSQGYAPPLVRGRRPVVIAADGRPGAAPQILVRQHRLETGVATVIAGLPGGTPPATWWRDGEWIVLIDNRDIEPISRNDPENRFTLRNVVHEEHWVLAAG